MIFSNFDASSATIHTKEMLPKGNLPLPNQPNKYCSYVMASI